MVSFKKKQFIGLGITVFFLVLLLSVVLFMTNSIKTNMLEVVEDRYYKVNKVTDIRQLIYLSDRHLLYVVNRNEQEDIGQSIAILEFNQKEIHNGLIELSTIINRSEARIMLGSIQSNSNVYGDMERRAMELSNQGATNEELRELYYSQRQVRDEIIQGISDFKDFQQKLMEEALADANETYSSLLTLLFVTITLTVVGIVLSALWIIRSTSRRLDEVKGVIKQINYDDLSSIPRLNATVNDEIGEVSKAFNEMATSIEEYHVKEKQFTEEITKQNWIQTNSGEIINLYHKSVSIEVLAEKFISSLAPLMNAKLGAFYLKNGEGNPKEFNKIVSYADGFTDEIGRESFTLREGLIGQSAVEKQPVFIDHVPSGYTVISTGIGTVEPKCIVISPVIVKDEVVAVIEFASLQTFTDRQKKLLSKVLETLGIAITNILGRMEIERLLLESQAQTEELQSQSEELQAQSEELQTQSEELRMINEQLEERSRDAEQKSQDLQKAKEELEEKAKQLQLSSKYKSEFLANMSHELRTPLNSILLLSEMLSEDMDGNLTDEQKDFSRVINSSGQDLLTLINDILDLSKVEVKKLDLHFGEVNVEEFIQRLELQFTHIAKHKKLDFQIDKGSKLPKIFYSDEQRLQQVVKNLLSNAFKFTEKGSVSLKIEEANTEELKGEALKDTNWLKISVSDTGIGISKDKLSLIFEAFHQGDGATMRKYGGTGLGLSISREFTQLLGGYITVDSVDGVGSTFTVYVPSLSDGAKAVNEMDSSVKEIATTSISQKTKLQEEAHKEESTTSEQTINSLKGKTVVVVDDDHRNVYALNNALLKEGMNILTAENGLQCLDILHETEQVDIILMDIMMPVMDGYKAIKTIRNLENHSKVPIIALTAKAMKGDREKCLEVGASDYISKPLKLDQLLSAMRVWVAKG